MNKYDFILVGVLIVMCISSLFLFRSCSKEGDCVLIKQDGIVYGIYALSENREVRIPQQGDNYNVIIIEDSEVSVSDADCQDRICVKHRVISRVGESIICLPHRLSVTIIDERGQQTYSSSFDDEIDGISQ